MYLTQAQRLSGTGSFGWNIASGEDRLVRPDFRIFGYDRTTKADVELIVQRTPSGDRAAVQQTIDRASREGREFDHEYRLMMPGRLGEICSRLGTCREKRFRWHRVCGRGNGCQAGARETERKLRRIEAYLAETQHLSHTSSWVWDARSRKWAYRSPEIYTLFGFDPVKKALYRLQAFRDRSHPEDRRPNVEAADRAIRQKADFEINFE